MAMLPISELHQDRRSAIKLEQYRSLSYIPHQYLHHIHTYLPTYLPMHIHTRIQFLL